MRARGAILSLGLAAVLAAGCTHARPEKSIAQSVAPSPATPWSPPPEARLPAAAPSQAPAIPEKFLRGGATLTLAQILDLGLRANPATRAAWLDARASAAELGSKRAAYLPSLELDASITRQKQAAVGGRFTFLQTTYGPSASLSCLLLDFGGRQADIDEAKQALFAADWTHNAVIQNVVLLIEQEYYKYLNAKALLSAEEANIQVARQTLAVAQERHRAGVATIADVLQARTALSQAELNRESVEGLIQTIRGSLATAIGVPANIPVEVGELPEVVNIQEVGESVDRLIERAEAERPDLAAARLLAAKAQSHIGSARSEGLPVLTANGTVNRTYYYNSQFAPYANNYSGSVLFHFPIFTGFEKSYLTAKAREEAEAAKAQMEILKDQVVLQVWTSYYNVKTATQKVNTSRDLNASARQSQEVAFGRYRAGVGGILDLLSAQSAFANAQAQEVAARAEWFLAMAQLAHDTGALSPSASSEAPPSATKGN